MTEQVNTPAAEVPNAPAPAGNEVPNGSTPPAQVVTPAPAPTPSGDDKPGTKAEPYTHQSGSNQLDYAVNHFVNGLNLRADSPEVQEFLRNGNDAYLRGHIAATGGDPAALEPFLLMASAGRQELVKAEEARIETLRTEVEGYAGGKEQWSAMAEFVKTNAPEEVRSALDEALDKGGVAAQMAVAFIQSKMHTNPDVTSQGRDAVVPTAGAQAPAGGKVYQSRAEWRADQRALIQKHGHAYESTPEGKALLAAFNPALQ